METAQAVQTKQIAMQISSNTPQSGQKHRSSNNFNLASMPAGTKYLEFAVTGGGTDPQNIFFDVMQDKSMATDPVIYHNEANGNRTSDTTQYKDLYIANPTGAVADFTVTIYACFE